MNDIATRLSDHGLRITRPRTRVFEILRESQEPLAIGDIVRAAPDVDRVSVYRTLELFAQLSIVSVVHVGWKKRYEISNLYQKHHHHHLVCNTCGDITEINSHQLEHVIDTLTRSHNFTPTGHTFEITGTCASCTLVD